MPVLIILEGRDLLQYKCVHNYVTGWHAFIQTQGKCPSYKHKFRGIYHTETLYLYRHTSIILLMFFPASASIATCFCEFTWSRKHCCFQWRHFSHAQQYSFNGRRGKRIGSEKCLLVATPTPIHTFTSTEITAVAITMVAIVILIPAGQTSASESCRMSSSGQPSLQRGPEHRSRKLTPSLDPFWYQ